jgi:hypothetical protein
VGAFQESFTPPSGPAYLRRGVMSAVVDALLEAKV